MDAPATSSLCRAVLRRPPHPRRVLPLLAAAGIALTNATGCGGTDREAVARDLAKASAAYAAYVDAPSARGTLGAGTRPAAAVRMRAALAARFAVTRLDAARAEAISDPELSSLAVKIAATAAVIGQVRDGLGQGAIRLDRVRFGRASLDNLLATARDRGLSLPSVSVGVGDLTPRDQ